MTTDITMEEIVRLNAARTQGEWYTMAGGPRIELGDTGTIYDEGGHTESDAEFIAAAHGSQLNVWSLTQRISL